MRRIAQKAFVEHNAKTALQKIEKGRARTVQEFRSGEYVYVYRVPRRKKRRFEVGPESQENTPNKASWIGPGTVIATDGASLWVSMFGELWRVAREQCRLATNVEKQGIEEVMRSCQELVEEFKRSGNRKGYKDIREEEWPGEDEENSEEAADPQKEAEDHQVMRRVSFAPEEDDGYSPSFGPEVSPLDEIEVGSVPSSSHVDPSVPEPEAEMSRRRSGSRAEMDEVPNDAEVVVEGPRVPLQMNEEWRRMYERSQAEANRLDGLPAPGQPVRLAQRHTRPGAPYLHEYHFVLPHEETDESEAEEEENHARWSKLKRWAEETPKRDFWEVDEERGRLIRHHVQKRRSLFSPKTCRQMPVPLERLKNERSTHVHGEEECIQDFWGSCEKVSRGKWWKGQTVFFFQDRMPSKRSDIEVWASEKGSRNDEIRLENEPAEALEGWKKADEAEWAKILSSGAVRILSKEESLEVKKQLQKEGKLNRVLPTRMMRKYKHAELPGEPPTMKSRFCIRGDKDPDIFDLERFSPTVNTMNLNIVLQIAVSEQMEIGLGDLKNAFCQSLPLVRKNGKLYFKQPSEGLPGLEAKQIVEIIAGCYGLVDAPLHWRKSLVQSLVRLGYKESRMDPCLYKIYEHGKIAGLIAIEVDDLLSRGKGIHLEKMEQLRTLYNFGKWVNLREAPQGAAFNGRRLRMEKDGGIKIDMCKFIQERLEEIPLQKGRKSQKKELVTEEERAQARALCGSLNWLCKEGRPDAAGPSSLMSSRLTRLVVEDIIQLNEVVRNLKSSADVALKIQPLSNMQLAVITDASFGNDEFHSQGGQMILAHEPGLKAGEKVKSNLLWWRSAKLQRVVNSTLAAESQSLSKGLGDLLWMKVLFKELLDEKFNIKEWPALLAGEETLAFARDSTSDRLQECLAIVDAKSLYDHLSKETIGGQDKRTAIEIQIIRQELNQLNASIRWVDHPAMLADPLTKVRGATRALFDMLSSGVFSIAAEVDQMHQRKEERTFKVNRKLGSCENMCNSESDH